jgi:tetratricopeptide (TPR) repeat protein
MDERSSMAKQATNPLWQVPVFLAGVLALVGVWYGRTSWRGTEAEHLARTLLQARQFLSQAPPDLDRTLELAVRVLDRGGPYPDLAGQAHFLIGSGHARRTEMLVGPLAAEEQRLAREHFEQADRLGVPEPDKARLSFRLAKIWSAAGADPRRVIERLAPALEAGADDPFEGYGILAQAYLCLPTPDLPAALEASRKQLASPTTSEELLDPARLFRGELLLRMNEPAQAREILARVSPQAAPGLTARVRGLRAQSCQALGLWSEAAKLWQDVLHASSFPPADPGRVRYHLGRCYQHLGKPGAAGRAWLEALSLGGEEGQAAAFALAEVRLPADPVGAFTALGQALHGITRPADYRNSLVALSEARRLVELGCNRLREAGDYDRAQQLAVLYERIALPGVAAELRGRAEQAWAGSLRQAKQEKAARDHFCQAGTAYATVAEVATDAAKRAGWLRRSADRFTDAQDFAQALTALKKYLAVEPASERAAEGWFLLAKVYEELRDEPSALGAYHKCIEYDGPFAFRARYRLAEIDLAKGKVEDAEKTLMQNLQLMRLRNDDTAHEQTVFTLADLFYRDGNYHMALVHLKEALDRYPGHPRALKARLQLADCYQRMAAKEHQQYQRINIHAAPGVQRDFLDQYNLKLDMAVANFQKLFDDLRARQRTTRLSEEEAAVLRTVEFALPECLFERGKYDAALTLYEELAAQKQHKVEQLVVLQQICRCHWAMTQPGPAKETIGRIKATFQELDQAGAFRSSPGGQSTPEEKPWQAREYWVKWLDQWLKWADGH